MFSTDLVALLESGCALIVGTAGPDNVPHASRAWGLDVLDAGTGRVSLLVDRADALTLQNVDGGGRIAVTGADVLTLRSAQLKGRVVSTSAASTADDQRSSRYCTAYHDAVMMVDDIPRSLMQRMVPVGLVRCEIDVDEVFDQTPGPSAGSPLERAPS